MRWSQSVRQVGMVSVAASQPNGLIVCQLSVLAARVSSKS